MTSYRITGPDTFQFSLSVTQSSAKIVLVALSTTPSLINSSQIGMLYLGKMEK